MKKYFPTMTESPDGHTLAGSIPYWFFAFFMIPALMSLSTIDSRGQSYEIWLEIGYHVCNFVAVLLFFFRYLKDSFLILQVSTKEILLTAGICAAVICVLKLAMFVLSQMTQNILFTNAAFGSLLTTEADLLFFSTAVIGEQPIWGTLCTVFLVPVTTTCLLYASVFAPICEHRPWLAYLVMTVLLLVKHLIMVFCLWSLEEEMTIFLITLPVHLVACWAYEKTDAIWTPILIHVFSNAAMALLTMVYMGII